MRDSLLGQLLLEHVYLGLEGHAILAGIGLLLFFLLFVLEILENSLSFLRVNIPTLMFSDDLYPGLR